MIDAKVTGDLDAWARAAAGAIDGAVRAEISAVTESVYAEAKRLWPIRQPDRPANHPRGYSRSRLSENVRGGADGEVIGRLANDAGYAYQIKSRRVEAPEGSQYTAAWGGKMLALLEEQERIVQSGRIFTARQSGKGAIYSKAYKRNQRRIREQAARAKDAKHVWTLLVREPTERKSEGLRERLRAAILAAVERVR